MTKTELTKLLLMETMKALAKTKPVDKISIREITETAGINRKTFYYHYIDKQDLICSIFDYDITRLSARYQGSHQKVMFLDDIIAYLYSEKNFYISAIRSDTQNSLREHLYKRVYDEMQAWIKSITDGKKVDENLTLSIIKLLAHGLIGIIIQWVEEGMKEEAATFSGEYAAMILEAVERILLKDAANR